MGFPYKGQGVEMLDLPAGAGRLAQSLQAQMATTPMHVGAAEAISPYAKTLATKAGLFALSLPLWEQIEKGVLEKRWLNKEDVPEILLNIGIRSVVETIGGYQLKQHWEKAQMQKFMEGKLDAKLFHPAMILRRILQNWLIILDEFPKDVLYTLVFFIKFYML